MNQVDKYIENLCTSIIDRILENKIFNKTEALKIINPLVRSALFDVSGMQISSVEARLEYLRVKLPQVDGVQKQVLQAEISGLKAERRHQNKLRTELDYRQKYFALDAYLKERLSDEEYQEIIKIKTTFWKEEE